MRQLLHLDVVEIAIGLCSGEVVPVVAFVFRENAVLGMGGEKGENECGEKDVFHSIRSKSEDVYSENGFSSFRLMMWRKSVSFRVTKVRLWTKAVAAMIASPSDRLFCCRNLMALSAIVSEIINVGVESKNASRYTFAFVLNE